MQDMTASSLTAFNASLTSLLATQSASRGKGQYRDLPQEIQEMLWWSLFREYLAGFPKYQDHMRMTHGEACFARLILKLVRDGSTSLPALLWPLKHLAKLVEQQTTEAVQAFNRLQSSDWTARNAMAMRVLDLSSWQRTVKSYTDLVVARLNTMTTLKSAPTSNGLALTTEDPTPPPNDSAPISGEPASSPDDAASPFDQLAPSSHVSALISDVLASNSLAPAAVAIETEAANQIDANVNHTIPMPVRLRPASPPVASGTDETQSSHGIKREAEESLQDERPNKRSRRDAGS